MKGLLRHKRQHMVEAAQPDNTREVAESRAETLEDATPEATPSVSPADIKLVVGPPGCCGTSELPVRKQSRRA
jgi:hypothetical protein